MDEAPEETVRRIRREVKTGKWLIRWANELARSGLEPEEAFAQALAECKPLPSQLWINLARALWMAKMKKQKQDEERRP